MDHERRQNDVQIAEIHGKIDVLTLELRDFKDEIKSWTSRHEIISERACVECRTRIASMESFIQQVNTPVKAIGWSVAVVATAMLGGIGIKIWKWLEMHF